MTTEKPISIPVVYPGFSNTQKPMHYSRPMFYQLPPVQNHHQMAQGLLCLYRVGAACAQAKTGRKEKSIAVFF